MEREEVRVGRTEAIFRNVNERIAESAGRFGSESAAFVCECGNATCTDRIEAPLDAYEHVRKEATRFLLAPGHEDRRIERVLEQKRRFSIVEKFERRVAATVTRLNPRAAPSE